MSGRVDDALTVLRQTLMRSMSVTDPFLYPHDVYDEGMASLDVLAGELERLRGEKLATDTILEEAWEDRNELARASAERDALAVQVDEWKLEAERRGLPKELMQRLHRAEAQVEQLKEALLAIAYWSWNGGLAKDLEVRSFAREALARAALEAGPASLADGLSKREPGSTTP